MARLKFTSQFKIALREELDGVAIDPSELRQRWHQLNRSLYTKRFTSREHAERVLASLVESDRIAADWCEVEEVLGFYGLRSK